jgi:glycosyltransferase involved in cell wall biosynthesis
MAGVSSDSSSSYLRSLAVLVPAWQPELVLSSLAAELTAAGFGAVVLVDDGSGGDWQSLFNGLARLPDVHLVRHEVNHGKGRALKSGFHYVETALPALGGVVTADADGQHRVEDIVRVGLALEGASTGAVLGVRAFSGDVPLRNRFGNVLTRAVFASLTGVRLSDTQSGLRGFSRELLPELSRMGGERYEYETTMLATLCRIGRKPVEIPIQTIYIDGNRSSHFDPLRDSARIYAALLRCVFSRKREAVIESEIG